MQLHEFQAKELLERYGILIPKGRIVGEAEDAGRAARKLDAERFVIKAQIRTTERLAEGGVRFAASPSGVAATAAAMLGQRLGPVTERGATSGGKEPVRWVLVEEAIPCALQLYVAVVLDTARSEVVLLTSPAGGAGIERRAALDPDLVKRTPLRFENGALTGDLTGAAESLRLPEKHRAGIVALFETLVRMAVELDTLQIEINPLALTPSGHLVALDAKLQIDDHALPRHPALAAFREAVTQDEEDPQELLADRRQINYAALDGSIGTVVNGAGLALATLDMIYDFGGRPANFMDIRTTATSLDIATGVELVLGNPRTECLLVNVHGGGMQRCDTIAEGIAVALRKTGRTLPIVARFAGNNADFARVRLASAGVEFTSPEDMTEAVRQVVEIKRAAG